MSKRYDPIMCMMVDEPTKAQDELSLAQKKQVVAELKGYLKKSYNFSDESEYARAYEDLRHMFTTGSRKSISGLFENTVKKTQDESYIVRGRKYKVVKRDGDNVTVIGPDGKVTKMDIDFLMSEGVKTKDSNALDEAIKTADGMFASTFGEYTKGAKFKKDKFLKELSGITDAEEFAKRMQTLDNELKNNLERLDEAYNVASKDYYAARNEIRSIMDAFSKEAFSLYRKLGIK